MNIIIIGCPGAGKSTQADLLSKKLNIPHISTGKVCREIASLDTDFGLKIKGIIDSGKLVSDEDMMVMLESILSKDENQNGFVGEGFPRSIYQAQNLAVPIDTVIYIYLSDEEATKRIVSRAERADDTVETVKGRLVIYHKETEPVLDFYRSKGLLIEVDGRPSIEEIHKAILKVLKIEDNE